MPLLFPKDSESLKILDIRLREVGAKRPLNGTSKVNRQTDRHTDTQTDRQPARQTCGQTGRQTDRQAGRQTGGRTDRQTGRQTDRKTGGQTETGRQAGTQADGGAVRGQNKSKTIWVHRLLLFQTCFRPSQTVSGFRQAKVRFSRPPVSIASACIETKKQTHR